jgi:MFS family permease
MAFLRNDAINRVNLHTGIQALAQGAGGIFFLVFLLRAGISVPLVLLAMAAVVTGRFVLRPAILPLAKRFGIKPLLIFGTLCLAVQYPILAMVDGVGPMLFVLIVVVAIGDVFYWPSYHAYFAALGDAEQRGQQVGAREALAAVVGILAPLVGAWAFVTVGPGVTFAAAGLVQALAVLPLIGVPNVPVKRAAPGTLKAARLTVTLLAIDGWFASGFFFVWQIALFVALGGNIPAYGGAMALAGLFGAGGSLALGRIIDLGHGRRAVTIGYGVTILILMLRAASLGSPVLAVVANALGALAMPLFVPGIGTAMYNMAKASPCALRFNMASEGGWDVGCFFGCLAAAAFYHFGWSLSVGILQGIPAAAAIILLLRRYYGKSGRVPPAAPLEAMGSLPAGTR